MIHLEFDFTEQQQVTKPKRVHEEKCHCCGNIKRTYTRSLNVNMCLCLIALVRHNVTDFVKVEDFLLKHGYPRCGDFSYLIHYGFLIKMKGERADGSARNGYYRITSAGIMFAENKTTAYEYFKICNNEFLGFSGKQISIKDAIKEKFDYSELMSK